MGRELLNALQPNWWFPYTRSLSVVGFLDFTKFILKKKKKKMESQAQTVSNVLNIFLKLESNTKM